MHRGWLKRITPEILDRAGTRGQAMPFGGDWVRQPESASDFEATTARLPPAAPRETLFITGRRPDAEGIPTLDTLRFGR